MLADFRPQRRWETRVSCGCGVSKGLPLFLPPPDPYVPNQSVRMKGFVAFPQLVTLIRTEATAATKVGRISLAE